MDEAAEAYFFAQCQFCLGYFPENVLDAHYESAHSELVKQTAESDSDAGQFRPSKRRRFVAYDDDDYINEDADATASYTIVHDSEAASPSAGGGDEPDQFLHMFDAEQPFIDDTPAKQQSHTSQPYAAEPAAYSADEPSTSSAAGQQPVRHSQRIRTKRNDQFAGDEANESGAASAGQHTKDTDAKPVAVVDHDYVLLSDQSEAEDEDARFIDVDNVDERSASVSGVPDSVLDVVPARPTEHILDMIKLEDDSGYDLIDVSGDVRLEGTADGVHWLPLPNGFNVDLAAHHLCLLHTLPSLYSSRCPAAVPCDASKAYFIEIEKHGVYRGTGGRRSQLWSQLDDGGRWSLFQPAHNLGFYWSGSQASRTQPFKLGRTALLASNKLSAHNHTHVLNVTVYRNVQCPDLFRYRVQLCERDEFLAGADENAVAWRSAMIAYRWYGRPRPVCTELAVDDIGSLHKHDAQSAANMLSQGVPIPEGFDRRVNGPFLTYASMKIMQNLERAQPVDMKLVSVQPHNGVQYIVAPYINYGLAIRVMAEALLLGERVSRKLPLSIPPLEFGSCGFVLDVAHLREHLVTANYDEGQLLQDTYADDAGSWEMKFKGRASFVRLTENGERVSWEQLSAKNSDCHTDVYKVRFTQSVNVSCPDLRKVNYQLHAVQPAAAKGGRAKQLHITKLPVGPCLLSFTFYRWYGQPRPFKLLSYGARKFWSGQPVTRNLQNSLQSSYQKPSHYARKCLERSCQAASSSTARGQQEQVELQLDAQPHAMKQTVAVDAKTLASSLGPNSIRHIQTRCGALVPRKRGRPRRPETAVSAPKRPARPPPQHVPAEFDRGVNGPFLSKSELCKLIRNEQRVEYVPDHVRTVDEETVTWVCCDYVNWHFAAHILVEAALFGWPLLLPASVNLLLAAESRLSSHLPFVLPAPQFGSAGYVIDVNTARQHGIPAASDQRKFLEDVHIDNGGGWRHKYTNKKYFFHAAVTEAAHGVKQLTISEPVPIKLAKSPAHSADEFNYVINGKHWENVSCPDLHKYHFQLYKACGLEFGSDCLTAMCFYRWYGSPRSFKLMAFGAGQFWYGKGDKNVEIKTSKEYTRRPNVEKGSGREEERFVLIHQDDTDDYQLRPA